MIVKCPYCNTDMIKGKIKCHRGIYNIPWVSVDKNNKMVLVDALDGYLGKGIRNVFFCNSCKLFIKKLKD